MIISNIIHADASIYRDGRFGTNINKSYVSSISCSSSHVNVRECSVYAGCFIDCTYQYGIKCFGEKITKPNKFYDYVII